KVYVLLRFRHKQAQPRTKDEKDRPSICRQPLPILISTWPREVEEVLAKHEGIVEAAVIEAYQFLPRSDRRLFCRDRIAVYKAPREVEFIDALPRNPSGKVLKRELRLGEPKKEA